MSFVKICKAAGIAALLGVLALAPIAASASELIDYANTAFDASTGPTSIPIGHADFCRRFPQKCGPNAKVVREVQLTEARWHQLLEVNSHFNTAIVPETDEQLYHVAEFWTYPHGFGDCEDIALAKQAQLEADGWPASVVLMTVAREADGEGHAVLMVRTDRGDFILDNQDSTVRDWKDSPYHLLKRQSQANAGQWVGLENPRSAIIVAKR